MPSLLAFLIIWLKFECRIDESEARERLRRRAEKDDETYDNVIGHLFDENTVVVDLEEIVRTATEQYEVVPQLAIEHISLASPSDLTVLVPGAPCLEEDLEIVQSGATVALSRDDETLYPPVRVQGRGHLPPSRDTRTRTTVYLDTDEGSVDVEAEIEYFREKLQNPEAWEKNTPETRLKRFGYCSQFPKGY